jgi:hypothetical protein
MSSQIKNKYDPSQPFHITLDLSILNNADNNNAESRNLRFLETRDDNFISCASNYFLSVTRFELQSLSIPQFIPELQMGQTDANKLIYQFWFSYNGVTSPAKNINFIPQNKVAPIPISPAGGFISQNIDDHYYDITNLQYWFFLLNKQIQAEYTAWAGGPSHVVDAPFFSITPQTGIIKVNADTDWDPLKYGAGNPLELHVNQSLFNLLATLPWLKKQKNGLHPNGYVLIFPDLQEVPNPVTRVQAESHSSCKEMHNPITDLVFTTGLFPVIPTQTSPPTVFGGVKILQNTGERNDIQPVITDFIVPVSQDNQYSPMVSYIPAGEYRLIDLYGDTGLSRIDINVYWKDKFGTNHPFQIEAGAWGSLKILFRRKDYGNVNLSLQ